MTIKYLNKAFPQLESSKDKILFSLGVSLFIYLFLLVFKPFNLTHVQVNLPVFLLGYGLITLVVLLLNYFVFFKIFPSFFKVETWTIGKLLLMYFIITLIISGLNWLYSGYYIQYFETPISFVKFFFNTLAISNLVLIASVLSAEKYLRYKHNRIAGQLSENMPFSAQQKTKIELKSNIVKENFEVEISHLIFIQSDKNYVEINYLEHGKLQKRVLRNSLKSIADQLQGFEQIKRCHKSYLVNLNRVSKVSGNAKNYFFHFDEVAEKIPVSRNFSKTIIKSLKSKV